jgi:hypothetical protein
MGFDQEIDRIIKQTEAYPLNILVWGPGSDSFEHFGKRQKIKQEISATFPNADVRFSEEFDLSKPLPGIGDSELVDQELWHLAACDLCVVLDTSKGAGEEIAYYSRSHTAHKLLILTHEKYAGSSSFPSALRRYRNQLFYDDHQYDTCSLVEHVLTRAKIVALGKITGLKA